MLEGNSHVSVVRNHTNAEAIRTAFEALQLLLIVVFPVIPACLISLEEHFALFST